jgi:hypothetical protein
MRKKENITRAEDVKMGVRARNGRVEYRTIEFNDTHKDWIQSMVTNGLSRAEIAESLGLSESGMRISLQNREDIQHILKNGALKTVKEATTALHKLAMGFVRYEKEYTVNLNKELIKSHIKRLIDLLGKEMIDEFLELLMSCSPEGVKNASGAVKVKEIEVPPNHNSAVKELEVHRGLIWDLETNRKKIPQVKIVVGLEGGTRKLKETTADYVVEN